uniref:F-box domain-containing protein n=1 Tax=Strongyloides papillosus TaxID=174720 RepID=A0A0N5CDX1_STREA
MEFFSLPDVLQLRILKELHWEDVNNLKLVCRDFYLTIVKNIEKLDKPKVEYLKIVFDEWEIYRVEYSSKCFEVLIEDMPPHHADFSNNHEYEDFLKDKDFTGIKSLVFENIDGGKVMIVVNTNDYMDEAPDSDNYFSEMSLRDTTSESLQITVSRAKEFRIPYNGILLKKESLAKMGLFEEDGLYLIMKQITMDVIADSPMAKYGNTSTVVTKPVYAQIMDHVCDYRCVIEEFEFSIRRRGGLVVTQERFYKKLFETRFGNDSIENFVSGEYEKEVFMECSKCGGSHINYIVYDEFQKDIDIWLHQ